MTTTQTSPAPRAKVAAGGIAGAIVTIIVWLVSLAGVDVPAEVAGAAVVIVSFAVAYLVPDRSGSSSENSTP